MDYKTAGVDIATGEKLVDWLCEQPPLRTPNSNRVVAGIGGFAALFDGSFKHLKEPLLVSSTDGVGTKVSLAVHFQDFTTVGQDLVAMCVNDLLCCGATPLFFLDYYATGKLVLSEAQQFLMGLRKACEEAQVALIGGETAEMPGVYHGGDFDCAGFSVGVVDRAKVLGAQRVRAGDLVLGISSSGFHSNGFSLLRKVFAKDLGDWRRQLMVPTALYSSLAMAIFDKVAALAHITGGGIRNVLRVLPAGTHWEMKDWAWPEPFVEVQKRSGLSRTEMLSTLNCGIGFVAVLKPEQEALVRRTVEQQGFRAFELGHICAAPAGDERPPTILNWES